VAAATFAALSLVRRARR